MTISIDTDLEAADITSPAILVTGFVNKASITLKDNIETGLKTDVAHRF